MTGGSLFSPPEMAIGMSLGRTNYQHCCVDTKIIMLKVPGIVAFVLLPSAECFVAEFLASWLIGCVRQHLRRFSDWLAGWLVSVGTLGC